MEEWFSRTELLIGTEGVRRLAQSRVMVVGIGGVGSYAVEALARAGVGYLTLVDGDIVVPSNLNRQLHTLRENIGLPKVEVMKKRILAINPDATVDARRVFYTPERAEEVLAGEYDYLVDAIDQVPAKVDLIRRAVQKGIPLVSAMGAGNKLDPTAFRIGDLGETHTCPLARAIRRRLRQEGIERGVKVVYAVEPPVTGEGMFPLQRENEDEEKTVAVPFTTPRRRPPGTISYMPGIMGLMLAGVVIRDLLGGGERG